MAQPEQNKGRSLYERVHDYEGFIKKFEGIKEKTTDDVFTPVQIYEALLNYATEKGWLKGFKTIVRPFYPNGDYTKYNYPKDCIVIDNPPFSIASKIVDFYISKNQPFILFCQSLTAGQLLNDKRPTTIILTNNKITFHNGAYINISFVAYGIPQLRDIAIKTAPDLALKLKMIDKNNKVSKRKTKYNLPKNVTSTALLGKYANRYLTIKRDECIRVPNIDEMKKDGRGIYGGAILLSSSAAEAASAAEKTYTYELSEREKKIIEQLDNR